MQGATAQAHAARARALVLVAVLNEKHNAATTTTTTAAALPEGERADHQCLPPRQQASAVQGLVPALAWVLAPASAKVRAIERGVRIAGLLCSAPPALVHLLAGHGVQAGVQRLAQPQPRSWSEFSHGTPLRVSSLTTLAWVTVQGPGHSVTPRARWSDGCDSYRVDTKHGVPVSVRGLDQCTQPQAEALTAVEVEVPLAVARLRARQCRRGLSHCDLGFNVLYSCSCYASSSSVTCFGLGGIVRGGGVQGRGSSCCGVHETLPHTFVPVHCRLASPLPHQLDLQAQA